MSRARRPSTTPSLSPTCETVIRPYHLAARGARVYVVPSTASFAEAVTSGPLILGLLAAAVAGLVSFASPCVIPLVPGYISYLAGVVGGEVTFDGELGWCEGVGGGPVRGGKQDRAGEGGGEDWDVAWEQGGR